MAIQAINNDYEQAIEDLRNLPEIGGNPRMKLVQPQSALIADGEAVAGEWYIEGMDSSAIPNPLIVSPKRVRLVRKLWMDGLLECQSDDGWTGIGNPGGSCGECPLKDWTDDKPQCSAGLEFGFEIEGLGILAVSEFKGSAIKTANLMVSNWRNQTDSGVVDVRFELSVSKRQGPNGSTYFTPIAKLLG